MNENIVYTHAEPILGYPKPKSQRSRLFRILSIAVAPNGLKHLHLR